MCAETNKLDIFTLILRYLSVVYDLSIIAEYLLGEESKEPFSWPPRKSNILLGLESIRARFDRLEFMGMKNRAA